MRNRRDKRLRDSLRLKAARYLAGSVATDGRLRAVPLTVENLAKRPELQANGISANRIEEIEQMRTDARPMELQLIAKVLGLPETWFTSEDVDELVYRDGSPDTVPDRLSAIEEQLRLARAETATRAAEVLRRIDDRLPPSRQSQSQRPA